MVNLKVFVGLFRNSIKYAEKAIPTTPGLVAFSALFLNVNKDFLFVTGSDGDITNSSRISVKSNGQISFLLPPKPIQAFLSTLAHDEEIELHIEKNDDITVIRSNGSEYKFRQLSATYPPALSTNVVESKVSLPNLEMVVKSIKLACPKDSPTILLDSSESKISLYSTDGYRLSMVTIPDQTLGTFKLHLPLKVLENASKINLQSVQVDLKNDVVRFAGDTSSVTVRQISTPYQNVETVVNKHQDIAETAILNKDELLLALQRLAAVSEGEPLHCEILANELTLSVSNISLGSGKESIQLDSSNIENTRFGVSLDYFKDAIQAHNSSIITLKIQTPVDPIYLLSESNVPVLTVVMPIKISL